LEFPRPPPLPRVAFATGDFLEITGSGSSSSETSSSDSSSSSSSSGSTASSTLSSVSF